ncbi:MAG: hypothetical protein H8E37_07005 [Planctomycetes bacterium]|nr:hypothetical protein [Planctomycetota bacterium]
MFKLLAKLKSRPNRRRNYGQGFIPTEALEHRLLLTDPVAEMPIILGIHSDKSETVGDGIAAGHAWVSVQWADGTYNTYGLWPDDHEKAEDNGSGSDVWKISSSGMDMRGIQVLFVN